MDTDLVVVVVWLIAIVCASLAVGALGSAAKRPSVPVDVSPVNHVHIYFQFFTKDGNDLEGSEDTADDWKRGGEKHDD